MSDNKRHLFKLVKVEDEVYPKRWKFENEGGKKTERNRDTPHVDAVGNKTKFGIATGTENSTDIYSIYCGANN